MKVLVIGAGAIGACAALRLAEAGARVTVLSREEPLTTLSAHSFGWANAIDEKNSAYYDLSIEALAAQQRLVADVGEAPQWLFRHGNLHWGRDEASAEAQQAIADGYRELGYPVEELTVAQTRELEPGLALADVAGPVHFYPRDVHVLGHVLLPAVLDKAQEAGAEVRIGTAGSLDEAREGFDAVLCCAGRGNADLLPGLPLLEPGAPERLTRGLLVRTTPVAEPVTRIIHAPGLSIRPHTGGRLVLHCHDLDRTLTGDGDVSAVAQQVLERLPAVLPNAADAEVEHVFTGVRPMPRDGMSIVGPVPGQDGVYVIATHSGLTLAPVLGEIAAREVLGEEHPLVEQFRLTRFA
uniref:Glycine/D-amino acid oxidase n=1 Tax=Nocardia interforma ATCC 21072 TaxID=1311815 RepID=A0A5S8ZHY1_9NOCA|nr:glycine/D-amino acid oxidase [Nocardia interforma ATCC 21072]